MANFAVTPPFRAEGERGLTSRLEDGIRLKDGT